MGGFFRVLSVLLFLWDNIEIFGYLLGGIVVFGFWVFRIFSFFRIVSSGLGLGLWVIVVGFRVFGSIFEVLGYSGRGVVLFCVCVFSG